MSSLSRKLAYVPGPTFGFVKLLASSGSHCTKWADEQHRQAGFESRLVPDLPLPLIPTLIGLRAFDLVSSRVWWEAATNTATAIVWRRISWGKKEYYMKGITDSASHLFMAFNRISRLVNLAVIYRLLRDDFGNDKNSSLRCPGQQTTISLSYWVLIYERLRTQLLK